VEEKYVSKKRYHCIYCTTENLGEGHPITKCAWPRGRHRGK